MKDLFDRVNNVQSYRNLLSDTHDKNFVVAFGVQPSEKPVICANAKRFVLYVSSDYVDAQRVLRTATAVGNVKGVYLPSKEDVLLYKKNFSKDGVFKRNKVLYGMLGGQYDFVVVTVEALMQYLPDRTSFVGDAVFLTKGDSVDTATLSQRLVSVGYKRTDSVSTEGEFVLRGDILDLSMPQGERYRISLWGDEIEEIRVVSSDNTAGGTVDSVTVYPLYDVTPLGESAFDNVLRTTARVKQSPDAKARLSEIVSSLQVGGLSCYDNVWLTPFAKCSSLFDYLPSSALVVWDEPKLITSRINFLHNEHLQRVANLLTAGEVLPLHEKSLMGKECLDNFLPLHQLSLQTLPYQSEFFHPQAVHNFKTTASPTYNNGESALAKDISNFKQSGYEVVLFVGGNDTENIKSKLSFAGVYLTDGEVLTVGGADGLIVTEAIEKGFVSHTNKLAVIGTRDLGRGMSTASMQKNKKQAFLAVNRGDYVVHDVHGIGLCEGVEKITSATGETKDYIVIMYKGGDRLYVPVDASNLLSRYSGGENPPLSKIGGAEFDKVKAKVKSGIKEMSINLLSLYAEREKARGFVYRVDDYLNEEFERYFPYNMTPDQVKCQEEIEGDLTSNRIMDRVLVGDVGFGKTEVAMRTAFDVVSNGYQVAVLVPTTILAEQHYETFKERMSHFDMRVACLNRFRSKAEQTQILKSVKEGKVDILIGTHRLLSKDVVFDKLGLLILDEEQRFGVEHKEKIKSVKTSVDVLTLSATPIPRTLHMALSGIRDISTITTPPIERLPVETSVVEESDALICDVIEREIGRGGQVFFVYNHVQSIDSYTAKLRSLLPNVRFVVAHGQMDEDLLEDRVVAFSRKEYDVLVCSTIIENGIDLPNANTIIVYDADDLGLSQLYQLRGRVGRSSRLAYAYFLYRQNKVLSEVAYKRLSSITEYNELGSGFKIAMKDLEIRGAGNILGREQHGHMMKVGYDMYARLLKETVAELRGETVETKVNVDLEIDIEAYAPDDYMPSQKERIDFYQQLALCESLKEVDNVRKQISEVYGVPPKQVANLLELAEVKIIAGKAGVCKVNVKPGRGVLTFVGREEMMRKTVFDALCEEGDSVSASSDGYSIVFSSTDFLQKTRLLANMRAFMERIAKT